MSSPLVLDVALYGRRIGTLTLLPGDQTLTLLPGDQTLFVFEQEYVGDQQRPALSLSFKDARAWKAGSDMTPRNTSITP